MNAVTPELARHTRAALQRVGGTCPTETCPVRTLTVYGNDDDVPAMICPVCHREML
jgi:hypothetical protein